MTVVGIPNPIWWKMNKAASKKHTCPQLNITTFYFMSTCQLTLTCTLPRCICADQRAGSANSSSQQADSTRHSTQDYPEQERSTEADTVPPLPEPMQAPARQVMPCDSSACHTCLKLSMQRR